MREELMEAPEGVMEAPEKSQDMAMEVCVPVKALAQPDDADQMQTPAEGDNVTMTVDAVVTRIEGDSAYLKPVSVNGTDLQAEKTAQPEEADMVEGSTLRDEASKMSNYA